MELNNHYHSLHNNVHSKLRSAILSLEIKPGTVLQERQIADKMNVSRTPVREALFKLEIEGLVKRFPNQGIFVTELTLQDVKDAYQIREFIEPSATALAVSCVDKAELECLLNKLTSLKYSEIPEKEKFLKHNILDSRLHEIILDSLENKYLTAFMNTISGICTRARGIGTPIRFTESTNEDIAIIRSMLDNDPKKAYESMHIHIVNTAKRLIAALSPNSNEKNIK